MLNTTTSKGTSHNRSVPLELHETRQTCMGHYKGGVCELRYRDPCETGPIFSGFFRANKLRSDLLEFKVAYVSTWLC